MEHRPVLLPIWIFSEVNMIVSSIIVEQLLTVIEIWETQYNYSKRETKKSFFIRDLKEEIKLVNNFLKLKKDKIVRLMN